MFLKQHHDWPFSFLLWSPVNQMLQKQDKTGTSTSSVCIQLATDYDCLPITVTCHVLYCRPMQLSTHHKGQTDHPTVMQQRSLRDTDWSMGETPPSIWRRQVTETAFSTTILREDEHSVVANYIQTSLVLAPVLSCICNIWFTGDHNRKLKGQSWCCFGNTVSAHTLYRVPYSRKYWRGL